MGLSFWIYIVIAIVAFIVRQMKKSAKTTHETPSRTSGGDYSDSKPAMTFEELLREIQASKTPPQPAQPARVERTDYEAKSLETIPTRKYDDTHSLEIYEKAKNEAFSRPSLEETLKLSDTVMKYSHFKEYEEASKNSVAKEVLADLKEPEGFKKAFIMSEILKRKF
ncbi:MAG: hypothetical protein WDO14_25400 [Bacteroidota bacterium]